MLVLHATVLDEKLCSISLNRLLISSRALATEEFWSDCAFLFIDNVLARYDIPGLIAVMAGRCLLLVKKSVDVMQSRVKAENVQGAYAYAREAFRLDGSTASFRVVEAVADEQFAGMAARLGN